MRNLTFLVTMLGLGFCIASGCASSNRIAYQTTGITMTTVTTGMKMWGDYVRTDGHVPIVRQRQVKAAYEKYAASIGVARDGVVAYSQSNNANQLDRVVLAVSTSASDLLGLLQLWLPADQALKLKAP